MQPQASKKTAKQTKRKKVAFFLKFSLEKFAGLKFWRTFALAFDNELVATSKDDP